MNKGFWCIILNYIGDFYGFKVNIYKKCFLNYMICNGNDLKVVYEYFRIYLEIGLESLLEKFFYISFLWLIKGNRDFSEVIQSDVLNIVNVIKKNNMLCGLIVIDGKWEDIQGDF